MHELCSFLQPGPIVDSTADHEGLVAAGILDGIHRSGLGLLPHLLELLGDALRDSLGRSMLACVGDEYSHFCHFLSKRAAHIPARSRYQAILDDDPGNGSRLGPDCGCHIIS